MKTFKYIFLLGALLLASCTDFLDKSPDDMETLDMVLGIRLIRKNGWPDVILVSLTMRGLSIRRE